MAQENRADEVAVQGGLEGVRSTSPFSEEELNTRTGHRPDFLGGGITLPLPDAGGTQIWLHYTHFSILMDRARRQALLTVVDIDGAKWVNIKRRKPDVWYPDPRLKNDEQPERDFFQKADPSFNPARNDFGFGHLVRRQDPNYDEPGDDEAAERSEYETFYLTNASPQAESLNSGPWNTLEDIVLDDLKKTLRIPAVVLTGPIFDKKPPLLHGVFPIPRDYWKIVAWRSGNELAAVGWRQRQPDGVMPDALESVSVPFDGKAGEAWLIPIEEIAALTGLDLALYAAADTYRMRVLGFEGVEAAAPAFPLPVRASDLLMAETLLLGDDPPTPAPLPARGLAARMEVSSDSTAGIPAMAETWSGPGDEDYWTDITEDDVAAAAAAEGSTLESADAAPTVSWAADADSIDHAHLVPTPASGAFSLRAEDLDLLAALNDLPVDEAGDTPVLFGLRGCAIIMDHNQSAGEVTLRDRRPDHLAPRCVLGVWNRRAGSVHVFPGSTVPDRRAVVSWKASRRSGNLLPTGLYRYVVGPHATLRKDGTLNSRPGCFLLRNASGDKRVVVVRRSNDDLAYDLADMTDRTAPGDNIHPTFFLQPTDFSSFGCQTVVGTADSGGNHKGAWAEFRAAAGLQDKEGTPGKPYLYMLLTGTEAMLASALRRNGLLGDIQARRALRRLRFGSKGDAVLRLQARLGLPKRDGDFGSFTAESLNALQRGLPPKNRCDGIWTPDLDAALGWGVFSSFGV